MGSRGNRKARQRLLRGAVAREEILHRVSVATESEITLPNDEKVVLSRVPAKMPNGEIVGDAILYEDGTVDLLINDDISEEAKATMSDTVVAFNKEAGAAFSVKDIIGKEV